MRGVVLDQFSRSRTTLQPPFPDILQLQLCEYSAPAWICIVEQAFYNFLFDVSHIHYLIYALGLQPTAKIFPLLLIVFS